MKPVKTDSRSCFGLEWYTTEAAAIKRAEQVDFYPINGGWLDGVACGRAKQFDYIDPEQEGRKLFAVMVP